MNAIHGYGRFLASHIKCGARVFFDGRENDAGYVTRWHASYGPRDAVPGYVPVRFDDGGRVLVHESRLFMVPA